MPGMIVKDVIERTPAEAVAADEACFGVNPMSSSGGHRAELGRSKTASHTQVAVRYEDVNGGRYRIRTYDFHRVKMALYR